MQKMKDPFNCLLNFTTILPFLDDNIQFQVSEVCDGIMFTLLEH
jgi:hypothetical protein